MRVIAAISDPYTVVKELHSLDHSYEIICLVPEYEDFITPDKIVVDINKMLSYFRSKLLIGELPSIISNSCIAGFMYNMLGIQSMGTLVEGVPLG
ncbi:hypothetical protein [Butyrivibrio sp. AE2032]|uniref:hypothetical protein n=1 Tax=Butyrivibrio sp. AE2032 TaxID=1458463 RepID=UPI000554E593|nr:hypothetical protein [Butyrivibrio sp. AE2032]